MRFVNDVKMWLHTPKYGTVVQVGNDIDLDFEAFPLFPFGTHAKVEFSDDGGVSWVTIDENKEVLNPGQSGHVRYGITVSVGSPSSICRVRVTSVSDPSLSATSDFFTVIPEPE